MQKLEKYFRAEIFAKNRNLSLVPNSLGVKVIDQKENAEK